MINQIFKIALISLLFLSCKNNNKIDETSSKVGITNDSSIDTLQISALYAEDFFISSTQSFKYVASQKIEITGAKGTKVKLPRNLFGTYKGEVEMNLVECYDVISMLNLNLSTYTLDGKPLETGGMIFVNFLDSLGQQLKPISHYSVHFSNNVDNRMKLFYSRRKNLVAPPKWELDVFKSDTKKVKKEDDFRWFGVTTEGDTIHYDQYIEVVENIKSTGIFFDTKEIGWLNCDRFLKFDNTVSQILLLDKKKKSLNYFILLKNYKTISLGHLNRDGNIIFNPIPKDENVVLVGVNFNDDIVDFTINRISISEEPFQDKQIIQRLSTSDFKTRLMNLGIEW